MLDGEMSFNWLNYITFLILMKSFVNTLGRYLVSLNIYDVW